MSKYQQKRLFVAPHLDDCAISFAGTLLAESKNLCVKTKTYVVTVFSRSNFTKEGLKAADEITAVRQAEEKTVMSSFGLEPLFLGFLESPLRGYIISDPLDYPKQLKPELDTGIVEKIAKCLRELFEDFDEILIPLSYGEKAHIDHTIVRTASLLAHKHNADVHVSVYEDVPYITEAERSWFSSLDGIVLKQTAIDLEAKINLIQNYKSQPVDSWEEFIRAAAENPPVERRWTVQSASALESLVNSI